MAKKSRSGDLNVSAAIREYLGNNPDVGPTEAAKAISEKIGQTVPASYVSTIKTGMKSKAGSNGAPRKRRGRRPRTAIAIAVTPAPAATRQATNGSVDLVTLESMKQIVGRLGADTARQLIDILA